MNKTIIININGFVFHIEEDAYEILKNYMTDVKRHFLNSADSLEITTDIENRIAEMFTEILAQEGKQVIVEQDVTAVIGQMGRIEDFEYAEENDGPAFQNEYAYTGSRTLFRDSEDHLVGGVCSGLAYYFGIQAIWVRLLFAISFVFAGTGVILYIILWAVIPKAATRADRMAMKGQKLNLQGFKKNFEEELTSVRGNFNDFGNEAKPFVYKTRDFIGEFFHHLGSFFSQSGKVLVKLIGIILLLASLGFLIALVIGMVMAVAYGRVGLYHVFPFNLMEHQVNSIILWAGFLLLAIPLFVLMMVGIGLLFENYRLRRGLGSSLLIIWMCTLSVVIYYAVKIGSEFRHSASFTQNVNITPTGKNIYYLKLDEIKYLTAEDSARLRIKERFKNSTILNEDYDNSDDFDSPSNVSISIEKSDVATPVLVEAFSARGIDYEDALTNAQNTSYHFTQKDSVLQFYPRLEKPVNRLWRNQEVHLILKVPVNATVIVEKRLQNRIEMHNVNVYECNDMNKTPDAKSAMFIMTADGLQCKVDSAAVAKRQAAMKNDE